MNRFYRIGFVVVIVFIFLAGQALGVGAQIDESFSSRNNGLLTEIRIDVKYIKENIQNNRDGIKELKTGFVLLDKRITLQEDRNIYMAQCIDRVDNRDGWLLSIIGTFMAAMLALQYKRSRAHRKEDEENGEKDN